MRQILMSILVVQLAACAPSDQDAEVEPSPNAIAEVASQPSVIGMHKADARHIVDIQYVDAKEGLPFHLRVTNHNHSAIDAQVVIEANAVQVRRELHLALDSSADVQVTFEELGLKPGSEDIVDLVSLVEVFDPANPTLKLDTRIAPETRIVLDRRALRIAEPEVASRRLAKQAQQLDLEPKYELEMMRVEGGTAE